MRKIENHCVDCGLPCLGSSCPYVNVPVDYCDICGTNYADYRMEGEDYCRDCAIDRLQEIFDDMTISEKAKALNTSLTDLRY